MLGNIMADVYAKLGAKGHPHDETLHALYKSSFFVAKEVTRYMASVGIYHAANNKREKLDKKMMVMAERPDIQLASSSAHLLAFDRMVEKWRCKRCLTASKQFLTGDCWSPGWSVLGHTLVRTGPYIFCSRCGSCTKERAIGLNKQCSQSEAKSTEHRRLEAGRHPTTLCVSVYALFSANPLTKFPLLKIHVLLMATMLKLFHDRSLSCQAALRIEHGSKIAQRVRFELIK